MNNPPVLDGSSTFRVRVGEESTYYFSATDANNFTVSVSDGLPVSSSLDDTSSGQYEFSWTLADTSAAQSIEFVASDDMGATSMLVPLVEVCACQNGGECVFDGTYNGLTTPQGKLIIMSCSCTEGKTGIIVMIALSRSDPSIAKLLSSDSTPTLHN